MLESLFFLKGMSSTTFLSYIAGAVGFAGGVYYVYRQLPNVQIEKKVKEIFQRGEISIKKGKREEYPTIDNIIFNPTDETVVQFTLPVGLDPSKVEGKKWLFQQQFDTDDVVIERNVREVLVRVR